MTSTQVSEDLRVASFNVRTGLALDGAHLWWRRRHSLLTTIRDLNVDVLGLQELRGFQRRWLARRLPEFEFHGTGRSRFSSGEATPVAVRTNGTGLKVVSSRTRWFGATPDRPGSRIPGATHPRIATTVVVRSADGTEIEATSLHLDQRSEKRRTASTRQLLGWLSDTGPRIVMGDFNAGIAAGCTRSLLDTDYRSVLPTGGSGTFHGFTATTHAAPIDHILVSAELDVVDATVVERHDLHPLPSDHWPVVATLRLTRGSTEPSAVSKGRQ